MAMVVVVVGGDSRNETPSIFRKEKSPVRAERIDAFVILFYLFVGMHLNGYGRDRRVHQTLAKSFSAYRYGDGNSLSLSEKEDNHLIHTACRSGVHR